MGSRPSRGRANRFRRTFGVVTARARAKLKQRIFVRTSFKLRGSYSRGQRAPCLAGCPRVHLSITNSFDLFTLSPALPPFVASPRRYVFILREHGAPMHLRTRSELKCCLVRFPFGITPGTVQYDAKTQFAEVIGFQVVECDKNI